MSSKKLKQIVRKKNMSETETEEIVATVNLPYIPGVSNTLKRIFRKHKIKGIFNSKDTLRKILSHPKDKIPQGRNNNVIYQIPCSDCNAVYIGETKRKFDCRVQEHKKAVQNGDISKNEIANHSWTKNHNFNWDGKKILDREKGWTARKVKETIFSIKNNKHINSISYNLPDIWLPALRKNTNTRKTTN